MRDRVKFFLIFGISLLLIGCIGMSFALFTTDTERKGALNIIVANTSCPLESDELDENNQIILNGGESKEITVKLTNSSVMPVHSIITYTSGIEDIKIYYIGSNVDELENDNLEIGENKTYRLVVENNNNSTQTITVNARCGLANKDLTLNENEKTINELYDPPVDLSKVPLMKAWNYSEETKCCVGDMDYTDVTPPSEDFHEYYEQITNITFSNKLEEPEGTINKWDVSEAGDGRVMAYMLNDEENPGNYKVIIAGDGGVYANPKHDRGNKGTEIPGLLKGFTNVKKMDVTYLNVSQLTDMSYMFGDSGVNANANDAFKGTEIIGLENWNVSKATNMSYMFSDCSQLTDLDLSGWDTSSVTSMYSMFYNCSQLSNIGDLSDWNTSSVTDMSGMFNWCHQLTSLGDLSGWDTTNITSMSTMFYYCSQLSTTITIRGNVTSYWSMFSSAATAEGASITVNYIDDATMAIAQTIVNDVNNPNIKLGTKVS